MYRNGTYPKTPEKVSQMSFRSKVRQWSRIEYLHGPEGLKPITQNRRWSPDEKLDLIMEVKSGKSAQSVAIENRINEGELHNWLRKYELWGYNGLTNKKKGRKPKNPNMKKCNYNNPRKIKETEYEELLRLRAENEYMRTEIEVIKKEIALREEKQAAQLKAKKQRLSKNSEKKDTN